MKRRLLLLALTVLMLILPAHAVAAMGRRVDLHHTGAYDVLGDTTVTPLANGRVQIAISGLGASGTVACQDLANCPVDFDGAAYYYTQDIRIVIDVIGAGVKGSDTSGLLTLEVGDGITTEFGSAVRSASSCVSAGSGSVECLVVLHMRSKLNLPESGRSVGGQATTIVGVLTVTQTGGTPQLAWRNLTTSGTLSYAGDIATGTDI